MSKMKKCENCGEEMAVSAKSCPKCGAKNKKPFYKKWWIWAIAAVALIAVISSSGGNQQSTENGEKTAVTETEKEKYEVIGDVTFEKDSIGTCYIKGTVKNNSGEECSYLQITYNLYDAEGNQIGTAMDNINNLEKDGTWKFSAMALSAEGEVASFKLAEITGF